MCAARFAIEMPSSPSTVARLAAARRMVLRLRWPSERGRRIVFVVMLDKIARPVVLSSEKNDRSCLITTSQGERDEHVCDSTAWWLAIAGRAPSGRGPLGA